MKNLSLILAITTTLFLIGCGSGSDPGRNNPAPSKSTLRIEVTGTTPPPSPIGGISLKVDYDQSTVRPHQDINENPETSVSLSGVLPDDGTIMAAFNNGDTLTLNLINANGFENWDKKIKIDFDVLSGTPGTGTYHIVPGTFKLFDLNGEQVNGVEVALAAANQ